MITLSTAGPLLYGARWQAPLARALGVSRRSVLYWAAGAYPTPADMGERLRKLLRDRRAEISAALK